MNERLISSPFATATSVYRRIVMRCLLSSFGVLLGLCAFVTPSWGQTTASILGTVTDSTGAVVPEAQVTVKNPETGFVREVTTSDHGTYEATSLPIGTYVISAKKESLKQTTAKKITLQVAQQALVDITLVAGATATVTVDDTAALVQTQESSIGQVISNKQIVDLPLNGRHVTELVSLTPGAMRSGYNGGPAAGSNTGFRTASLSGGQTSKTEFIMDGLTDTEELYNGIQFEPSVDFIQEFKVVSNSASAQYGYGTGVVLMATKNGTNHLHGTVFEFIRLDTPGFQLDARNYFAPKNSLVASLRQNQFGASFGGPIFKNRLFYYLNYEGTRTQLPITHTIVEPSAALRGTGDIDLSTLQGTNTYSATACSTNSATCLHNPFTGGPFPVNSAGHYYIPANMVDTAALFFLNPDIIPLPNQPDGVHYIWTPANTTNVNQGNIRIDDQMSPKDSIFGRFSISDNTIYNTGAAPTTGGVTATINTKNIALGYTHIFSPHLLNDLRAGLARLYYANTTQGLGTNYITEAGVKGFEQTASVFPGYPVLSIGSSYTGVTGTAYSPLINPTQTYQLTDMVTWNKGLHSFVFGVNARRFHLLSTNAAYSRGSIAFTCNFSGNGYVDYLLGLPCSGSRDYPRNIFGERFFNIPFFAQDDWRVTKNLTLNLGIRYDFALAPRQDLDQNSYFDVKTGNYIVSIHKNGLPNLETQQVAQVAYNAYASHIIPASQVGLSNNLQTISKKNFAPRIGFAYRPFNTDKTVFRGGYGIFYDLPYGNSSVSESIINLPFILDSSQSGATCIVKNPCTIPVSTPNFENFFNYPYGVSGLGFPLVSDADLHVRPPYNQEWNLAVQQALAKNVSLQIAYVGNKGTRLEHVLPLNYPVFGTTPLQSRRPQPLFGAGNNYTDIGTSIYHALQTTFEARSSSGLYVLSAFTWGKLIDDLNIDDSTTVQDPTNARLDRALGAGDIKLRSVTSVVYSLPFGRGLRFGTHMPRGFDYVAGGWRVAAEAQMQSGIPFTVTESTDPFNSGSAYGTRPNRVGLGYLTNPTIKHWFDTSTSSFTVNPTGSGVFGTSGRNILRGPGSDNWDISLMKDIHYAERGFVELRLDAFNAFNHPQFGLPNANIQSGASVAGAITTTATATNSRELQGAVKVYF